MMPWMVSGTSSSPDTLHHAVAVAFPPEQAEIEQGLDHLLDEERHAFRLVQERLAQRRRHVGRAEQLPGHGHGVRLGQRVQRERGVEAARRDRRGIADPIGEDQHERHARHRVGHRRQVLLGAGVDPVQVLEDQDQGTQARSAEGQRADRLEALSAAGARLHVQDAAVARIDREQVANVGDVRLELSHPAHAVLDLGDDLGLAVEFLDAESSAGAAR